VGKRIGGWACGRIGVVDRVDGVDLVDARFCPVVLDSREVTSGLRGVDLVELCGAGMEGASELQPSRRAGPYRLYFFLR
jgi:hypothetical protein